MLPHIPHTSIYNHAKRAGGFCARRHEPTPARRIKALWLLNVHDMARFVGIGEMQVGGRARFIRFDHFHRYGGPVDAEG